MVDLQLNGFTSGWRSEPWRCDVGSLSASSLFCFIICLRFGKVYLFTKDSFKRTHIFTTYIYH